MTKTILASSVLSALFLIIQTTWLKNGLFWGVIPDFALLVILWVAYKNSHIQGTVTAFVAGIFCDLLSSSPLGYFAFIYLVPAYLVSFVRKVVDMDVFFIPVILGFVGTLVKGFSSLFLLVVFGPQSISAYSLGDIHFWIEAALNGAASPLLFFLLGKINRLLVTRKVTE